MPDMGFPHDRHDDSRGGAPRPLPHDWREALSALPLDTPDGDGWARLAACLPVAGASDARPGDMRTSHAPPAPAPGSGRHAASTRRRRRFAWLALAATLAVIAAIPLRQRSMSGDDGIRTQASQPSVASTEPATTQPAPDAVHAAPPPTTQTATTPASVTAGGDVPADGDTAIASAAGHGDGSAHDTAGAAVATDSHEAAGQTAPRRHDIQDTDAVARREAGATAPVTGDSAATISTPDTDLTSAGPTRTAASIREPDDPADNVADTGHDDFERLYAESARLEALVAIARDDSMASAPATVLTASLDERIGRIDGALSQPGLGRDRRLQLWQSRVEALHELAGVEATRRWRSARGESWDAALVQID